MIMNPLDTKQVCVESSMGRTLYTSTRMRSQQELWNKNNVELSSQSIMDQIGDKVTLKRQDKSQVKMSLYWQYQYLTDSSGIVYLRLILLNWLCSDVMPA